MAEMVGSAVVQEAVSGAVSLVFSNHEEKPSKRHTMDRLEMAHHGLEFALERSSKLPITDVSLLRQRRLIKRFYEECGEVLDKHKVRVLEDEEGVTNSSSFPKRIIHTVKSFVSYYLFSSDKDELSLSQVRRFEWYADVADRFVRRVESGCSLLAHYMFFDPLITQLLQGKNLGYRMVQGSQIRRLRIYPLRSQEHGILAALRFDSYDRKIQTKCFISNLWLRLSESTDIIGIATKCLQSLGPQFKSLAQVAAGELSQLPTQNFFSSSYNSAKLENYFLESNLLTGFLRPNPLCCMANGHIPCANNVIPSELSYRFPEQVILLDFQCFISAFEYNMQSSVDEAERNVVNDRPILMVSANFFPHSVDNKSGDMYVAEVIGEQMKHISGTNLQQADEMVLLTNAVNCFIHQPELTRYRMKWKSLHGAVYFSVEKPKEKVRPKPRAGPMTRRAAKRRR